MDVHEPRWPLGEHGAVPGEERLVGRGHDAPHVAQDEQGDDAEGDAGQPVLLLPHDVGRGAGAGAGVEADAGFVVARFATCRFVVWKGRDKKDCVRL